MNQIQKSFGAVSGLPCWGVKRGQGSFLTLEFGDPHLIVREPVESVSASVKIRRRLARRHVYVAGQWHLWVYCCDWWVRSAARVIGDSSSSRKVERAARYLDGQRLTGVSLGVRGARTVFAFERGDVLETRPYDRRSEQWILYEPRNRVLVLRADRKYCYQSVSEPMRSWRAV